jgi:hypothetical protein
MRNLGANRVLIAGIAGIILGIAAEALVNRIAGATVFTDGMLWGAVLGVLVASLPNFTRMGALVSKSEKPAVRFLIGVALFILISLVIMGLFFGVVALLGRVLH